MYTACASFSHIADRVLTAQMSKHMHLKLLPREKQDQEKKMQVYGAHDTCYMACGPSDALDQAKQMVYLSGVQPKPFLWCCQHVLWQAPCPCHLPSHSVQHLQLPVQPCWPAAAAVAAVLLHDH